MIISVTPWKNPPTENLIEVTISLISSIVSFFLEITYSIKLRANCYGSDIIVVVDVIREDERWKIIDVQ